MPDPQTNRPEPGGQVAAERSAGQAAVPPQGTRQQDTRTGPAREGTTAEGTAQEGTAREGTTREGTTREGTTREGTTREGTARQATAQPPVGQQAAGQGGYREAGASDAGSADAGYEAGAGGTTTGYRGVGMFQSVAAMAWGAALAAAIGMIAVGIMLLVWPSATLTVVAVLIGAALVVAGVLRLFDGAFGHGESGGMRAADIVIGLLAIVAGLYCLKHHALTVLVVALVVGVIWIIHGISDLIVAATSGPVPGRGMRAIGGVFSLAAGLVILFWPGISLVLLLTILGAWLLLYGVVLAALAFRLRSQAKTAAKAASRQAHPAAA